MMMMMVNDHSLTLMHVQLPNHVSFVLDLFHALHLMPAYPEQNTLNVACSSPISFLASLLRKQIHPFYFFLGEYGEDHRLPDYITSLSDAPFSHSEATP